MLKVNKNMTNILPKKVPVMQEKLLLLLVTILTKTLLPFVGGHLMTLALFSAWHDN